MKLIYATLSAILVTGCYKKPAACIEVKETNFILSYDSANSCSTNSEYHIWLFDDGTASEQNSPRLSFSGEGEHSVTLRCYSQDGRKIDETSATFFRGYMYIDSVVIYDLSHTFFQYAGIGDTLQNISLRFGQHGATEIFVLPTLDDLPFTFSFEDNAYLDTKMASVVLYETTSSDSKVLISESINPHVSDSIVENVYSPIKRIGAKIYWHFNK
ncbi:MAG: hypothetical protein JKY42_12035 [Flavobacteriales bacterium]|nr:hypothetical protein [Flavobacteriales bacterium]